MSIDEAFMRRTTDNLRSLCAINNPCSERERFPSHSDALEFPDVDCDEVYPDIFLGNEWVTLF